MASNPWISLSLSLLLAACGGGSGGDGGRAPDAALEAAARQRELVRDAGDAPLTGLFARGTDRLCAVERGDAARIGIVSDYGDGIACAATGVARAASGALNVTLGTGGDCAFTAEYDGARIVFPARLPDGCERFCTRRASLSAISVERLSDSVAEAVALRDPSDRPLCDS